MAHNSRLKPEISDEELIQRFQNDDLEAYDLIIMRYRDQLLNFAYRFLGNAEESEDVVQETFLRLWRNRHAYRQIAKFSTWIYTIAGNLAKTELRKRKRRKVISITDMGFEDKEYEIEDEMASTDQQLNSELTDKIIQSAINELPPRFKEVIILRDIQELSYEDIGSILQIPLGTVKSRVNRARLKLQGKLKDLKTSSS